MAAARRLRLVIEWDDDGSPDYDESGEESGYLAFVNGLSSLGAEVIDETTV